MTDLVIFALLLVATLMAFIGIATKVRIFNIFSAGIFLALILELQTSAAIVVTFVGIIIFQAWYALTGGSK